MPAAEVLSELGSMPLTFCRWYPPCAVSVSGNEQAICVYGMSSAAAASVAFGRRRCTDYTGATYILHSRNTR